MSLSGTKTQNIVATAILVSAVVLFWSAEAAPKNPGHKQTVRNASPDITTQIGRKDPNTVTCYAYNNSSENICVVYDVYPVWNFSQPARGMVSQSIPGKSGSAVAWAFPYQQNVMQCKLVSARYIRWNAMCP